MSDISYRYSRKWRFKIAKAYKKVWMLKSIGSRSVQMNPMTFSRGYCAAVVSKLCYGMYLVNLKKRSLDKLDKMHVDVARNIQGLAPNIYIHLR